jgi:hypothetical protein
VVGIDAAIEREVKKRRTAAADSTAKKAQPRSTLQITRDNQAAEGPLSEARSGPVILVPILALA